MHTLFIALFALFTPEVTDSIITTDIEEIVVAATPKESLRLRRQPLSSTSFASTRITPSMPRLPAS